MKLVCWLRDAFTAPRHLREAQEKLAQAEYVVQGFEKGLRTDKEWMEWFMLGQYFKNITPPQVWVEKMKSKYYLRLDPLDPVGEIRMVRRRGVKTV